MYMAKHGSQQVLQNTTDLRMMMTVQSQTDTRSVGERGCCHVTRDGIEEARAATV